MVAFRIFYSGILIIEPKAIPPVVEAPLFSKTIIRFLSFIFSVKKHISLSDWLSRGATLESALRRPKLKSSLPHIHNYTYCSADIFNN